jgi:hypothetical protein
MCGMSLATIHERRSGTLSIKQGVIEKEVFERYIAF